PGWRHPGKSGPHDPSLTGPPPRPPAYSDDWRGFHHEWHAATHPSASATHPISLAAPIALSYTEVAMRRVLAFLLIAILADAAGNSWNKIRYSGGSGAATIHPFGWVNPPNP